MLGSKAREQFHNGKIEIDDKPDAEVILRSQARRLHAMQQHLEGLAAAIEEIRGTCGEMGRGHTDAAVRKMAAAFENRAVITTGTVKAFLEISATTPLTLDEAVQLRAICLSIRDVALGLTKWMWDLIHAFPRSEKSIGAASSVEDHLLLVNFDFYWLNSLTDRLSLDLSDKNRMKRLRERRRANMRTASFDYHDEDIRILEQLGLLPRREAHIRTDIDGALSAFVALSFEVAGDAIANAGRNDGHVIRSPMWRLRGWFFRLAGVVQKDAYNLEDWFELTGQEPSAAERARARRTDV